MNEKASRIVTGILTLVILAMIYQYVLAPPGWIIVEKIGSNNEPDKIISVSTEELLLFPKLHEAVTSTNTNIGTYPSPNDIIKCTNKEGKQITDYFGSVWWVDGNMYSFKIELDGQYFSIIIHFTQKLPPMA